MPMFNPPENYDPAQLRGDHVIKFKIIMPSNLTEKQKQIIRDFQKQEQANKEKFYKQSQEKVQSNANKATS